MMSDRPTTLKTYAVGTLNLFQCLDLNLLSQNQVYKISSILFKVRQDSKYDDTSIQSFEYFESVSCDN